MSCEREEYLILLNKVPRVPQVLKCPSSPRVPKWPSSAQVPQVPKCPSSTQVPEVPKCRECHVLICPSNALSYLLPNCHSNALSARVPEWLECPSPSVSQLVIPPICQLVYIAGSVS